MGVNTSNFGKLCFCKKKSEEEQQKEHKPDNPVLEPDNPELEPGNPELSVTIDDYQWLTKTIKDYQFELPFNQLLPDTDLVFSLC